ncbi:unnamed protein product [Adineta steineri]|uniref:G-protein coupled receptors family 1 profile domain-containing protein n=2 Tax=Adineta steineri TaxID=433720 RepID=A0A819ITQ1_9BILA|nr:unnamed protein product [Adineta steineri]
MMNETNSDIIISSEPELYRYLKLCIFVILEIPSILISIYIIYQFIHSRQFRSRLNNHSVIALIILSFIETTSELPIALQYLRLGHVQPMNSNFCLFWIWFNFSLQTTNLFLMGWTSIERHILIFHSGWVQTTIGKIKWHYIPLIFCSTYIPLFYLSCVIIYQCENIFDYSLYLCGSPCYNNITWLSTFDWTTNMLIPSVAIPFLSISLLLRVLIQAKKMKRSLNWRSTRKMTLQLIVISILYLIFWFPLALISLIRIYFIPTFLNDVTLYYLNYTPYLVQLLMPYVCIACLPEIWPKKIRIDTTTTTIQHGHQTINKK